jgi:hypothetical protein
MMSVRLSGSLLRRWVSCLVVGTVRRRIGLSPVVFRSWVVLGSDGSGGGVTEGRLEDDGTLGVEFTVDDGADAEPRWPERDLV